MANDYPQQSPSGLLEPIRKDFVAYALPAFALVMFGVLLLLFTDLPAERGFRNYLVASLAVYILASVWVASLHIQIQNRRRDRLKRAQEAKNDSAPDEIENIPEEPHVFWSWIVQSALLVLLIVYWVYRCVL